jgi:chromosome partitioning protein
MAVVFAVANLKGGAGKTTLSVNGAAYLAQAGRRVLVIDLDPQSNATRALGVDPAQLPNSYSSYEVLLNPTQGIAYATVSTAVGVDLVPAVPALSGAADELAGAFARELRLTDALEQANSAYDYIFIDLPPSPGLFTVNGLTAADVVLVPLQAQVFAWEAMPQLEALIALVRRLNRRLRIGGIVCMMVDRRTNLSNMIEEQARATYNGLVFSTVIPISTKLAESPALGEPIITYAPASPGAQAYAALAAELQERFPYAR